MTQNRTENVQSGARKLLKAIHTSMTPLYDLRPANFDQNWYNIP